MANFKSELPYLIPEFYLNFTFSAERQGRTDPATLVINRLARFAIFCHYFNLRICWVGSFDFLMISGLLGVSI